ncbi:dTDP-4-dehydrorhamnose reductase [Inconstantimicrobium mannanitabidum]|uniref:NAD(P)-dependent oxidoreductase n=1 Tax=Inconstantimicrobium mannanitabidum TaxID=1604901 RepID=A0ACB5REV3_9CLOT|nr:dTDP-4-dehydrorhamnose reductase [Clostridium sp. TW13]GKX67808.1 NAD(P)-dependent oxidoreductase [Clostridium sp. TW13]
MKIIVTGARGQLGSQIVEDINKGYSEIGELPEVIKNAEVLGIDVEELDISDLNKVKEFISIQRPDVVINPAAYTNVDGCESNEQLAYQINALGARNLAIACEGIGAKLLHISTDYVFSGEGNVPLKEYELPAPQSVYGKTKLAGEEFVREFCSKYYIVRTSWLYGYNGKNFVYTIMKAAQERGVLKVVNDQKGNPTNAEDLIHHLLKIILTDEYGIYHCTGEGECSWYDFASKIVEYGNIECIVNPCTSDEFPSPTKRPTYSSLDNMMLRVTVGNEVREWQKALKEFIKRQNRTY